MKFNRIRFSSRTQNLYGQLKYKTGLSTNVLARYGLCLSLNDPSIPNPDEFDEKGMEILPSVLFGNDEKLYMSLMIQRLKQDQIPVNEKTLNNMTRAHLNRGAGALHPRINDLSDFYEIIAVEQK